MTETIDRTLPAELTELARLALATDMEEIDLGFEGMDSEFPAPIGWQMHLVRQLDPVKPVNGREFLIISCQIGEEPQAYDPVDRVMWGTEQIKTWIQQATVRSADATDSEKAAKLTEAERMIEAWKLGWSASRTLNWGQKLRFESHHPQLGTLPLPVSFRFSSLNHFYNAEGHPEHRDNGAEVSYDLRISREGFDGEWIYVSDGVDKREDGGYYPRHLSIEDAHARVAEAPPWFARVAYSNDEIETWVL